MGVFGKDSKACGKDVCVQASLNTVNKINGIIDKMISVYWKHLYWSQPFNKTSHDWYDPQENRLLETL